MAKNTKSLKQKQRANQGLVLFAVLVIGLGGFALYRWYSIHSEKQKFEQVKASLDSLYADIKNKAGEPGAVERTQACGYATQKHDRGFRTCGDYLYFAYRVSGPEEANIITKKLVEVIKQNSSFDVTYSDVTENLQLKSLISPFDQDERAISFIDKKTGISCGSDFIFAHSSDDSHAVAVTLSTLSISSRIACLVQGARAEHYPVKAD